MCGIAGYFGPPDALACGRVLAMLRAQEHRGPDGAGVASIGDDGTWNVEFAAAANDLRELIASPAVCVLGHNLLAIQDRSALSRQPMTDQDIGLVFNGEVYDFVERRRQLESQGAVFRTATDTEVLFELWKSHGPGCLMNLRGMFAFAAFDRRSNSLWLARDQFGIKPLYFARTSDGIYFSSEIRSLHGAGIVPRKLHRTAALAAVAAGINSFGHGQTLYQNVHELPPGHWMHIRAGRTEVRQYWSLPDPSSTLRGEDATAALRDSTEQSVRLHLRSCRTTATCLSGGLDSTTVVWLIAKVLGEARRDFQAFTICTAAQESELDLAALVSQKAGVRHQMWNCPAASCADVLEMIVAYESPNHVIGPINQFMLLRKIAHSGVTVVLDGQGGDELLSGYPWFAPVLLDEVCKADGPTAAQRLRASVNSRLPLDTNTANQFETMFHNSAAWVRSFMWQREFLGWSIDQVLELAETKYYLDGGGDWRSFRRREYLRAELQYLLRQEDRLGMWLGLECRVPLVDVPLVQVASQIAADWLIHDGFLKYPFRVMLPDMPHQVRWNTRKRGFWEVDREQFRWVNASGKQLAADCVVLGELFPTMLDRWDSLSFDQHWRLLQIAVLERCADRSALRTLLREPGVGSCR